MLTIGIIGIVTVLLAVQFKSIKPEYGIMISAAACIFIFLYSLARISDIVEVVDKLSGMTSISAEYIKILLKITGITFISEIASDISKDCGYIAVANQIQIFGKLTVLVISLPVFTELISAITGLLTG
jgi:stage III sporulation protein AD